MPSFRPQLYNSHFVDEGKHFDDMRSTGLENKFYDVEPESHYRENGLTSDDLLDDNFSLLSGSGGMCDITSWLKFDNSMEDRREPRDNMCSKYENMMAYRRKCELEDIIMKEKMRRTQSNLNHLDQVKNGCPRLYCPGVAFLIMPNGDIHVTPPGQAVPTIDLQVKGGFSSPMSFSQSQSVMDQNLKKWWCSGRKSSPYRSAADTRSRRSLSSWGSTTDCQLSNHVKDDECAPLLEKILIKVRNVHPTACLHELHVQRRQLFPKKPTFNMTKFVNGSHKKGSFAVECAFEFNGARLYTHHTEKTKSDAKMNAARDMLRKLKSIPNLTIVLDGERTNSGAFASFEHPRCQLLYLHDTNPELYPHSPSFQPSLWRTLPRCRKKSRCINMICHFQVGQEKHATIGAANNKKQAIVQAARNMLKRLFPYEENVKDPQAESDQTSDRMKTPWTCHFCKIFMTGRKPFLSHLTGRSHIHRMSELGLNAEEENKILLSTAEEAFKKKEETKRNAALKSCTQRMSAQLQSNKNGEFYHNYNVMHNSSSGDSQESEANCKSATASSSENSEFETSYCHSSSGGMKVIE